MSSENLESETSNLPAEATSDRLDEADFVETATDDMIGDDSVAEDVEAGFSFQSREQHLANLTIGEILSHARQAQGFSLEDVEVETKIAKFYLRAIESNDIAELPELIYSLGFIKAYALFLDLDVEHCLRRFRQEHAAEIDRLHPV